MKILIFTKGYFPKIGGIEILTATLGEEWVKMGHEVQVITETNGPETKNGVRIWVRPSFFEQIRLIRQTDVFLMPNLSLKGFFLWLFAPWKKLVITHQTWYGHWNGKKNINARIKIFLSRFAVNISCSKFLSAQLPYKSHIIPNCYNNQMFVKAVPEEYRRGLVFVGRLVSDKGLDTLLEAYAIMQQKGIHLPLTIIGEGPEQHLIEKMQQEHPDWELYWKGAMRSMDLARSLQLFEIMVVPSKWYEPFGIVALEGLASGCKVVASEIGGLKEAVGSLGMFFENGNAEDCANKIEKSLKAPYPTQEDLTQHLSRFSIQNIAEKYMELMKK